MSEEEQSLREELLKHLTEIGANDLRELALAVPYAEIKDADPRTVLNTMSVLGVLIADLMDTPMDQAYQYLKLAIMGLQYRAAIELDKQDS